MTIENKQTGKINKKAIFFSEDSRLIEKLPKCRDLRTFCAMFVKVTS